MAAGYPTDYNPFNRVVHDPLHDFLLAEAQRSARQKEDYPLGKDEYEMRSAVEFLASFHMEEDVPVFKELLRFRGYEKAEFLDGTSTKPKVEHRFSVRDIAKRTLFRMNVSVP